MIENFLLSFKPEDLSFLMDTNLTAKKLKQFGNKQNKFTCMLPTDYFFNALYITVN